jgi:thioredoxin-dependent peroxiredoxin
MHRRYNEIMSVKLKVRDPAPDFCELAVGGKYGAGREVSLANFRGAPLVLYFYPKDDTPGCTTQACGLRDAWDELRERAQIFGVSADSAGSHEKFISKHQLPFPLLSDPGREMMIAYGVWEEKSMFGKKYMGVARSTFVIDRDGRIAAIFRKVKPGEHVKQLRAVLLDPGSATPTTPEKDLPS